MLKITKKKIAAKSNLDNYEKAYKNYSLEEAKKEISYFPGGKLNIAYNSITRNALNENTKNKTALIWESEAGEIKEFTFSQMENLSNKVANVLKKHKVKKGDRVFIILPRIPETYYSFIGIMKTGAIAGTMFAAFQEDGIFERLKKSEAKFVITNTELAERIKKNRQKLKELKYIFLTDIGISGGEDKLSLPEEMESASASFQTVPMEPDDAATMMFTSSTSYTPISGVVMPHQAVISQHLTAKYVLDFKEDDIYWCTADPGWITGTVYSIIANWSNAVTTVIYEGRFDAGKWMKIMEKYKVSVWYTAPTAIRMLIASGVDGRKYNLDNLRHMCSVGEVLQPDSIRWIKENLKVDVCDTYWQTETGSMIVANFPGEKKKIGSIGRPVPGVIVKIIDDQGKEVPVKTEGNIAIKPDVPSLMKTVWKNKKMYDSYFKHGWYVTGDRGYMDEDGYIWFLGRKDDIIKTSGERVGPAEVESALIEHPAVIDAGVIGKPDKLRGEIIKAFVVLDQKFNPSDKLIEELQQYVKKHLAGHAYPREVEFINKIPKNKSGKIVRRILKAKDLGLPEGDISTLEDD
ncbi:acetate--CoA ligase [Candidatus Falkowbacteria bacterium CG10_big_fil_rev_8_21_14_0_10_43_10]|uniref:Acetate--CoA ligase n=1 Tax=Candidatus Falkowbacteria bacterium CG10_big_fil_rev_8_21_14_0_10_43_10 TaxID=1974567 RepID=A0A2H0V198_9BACT|nr:MAG: acetate--CoA ligase [Candidatus Falkowbacteria bacterium CG10_big_fil_rev_8_21_14_0_10_43_10]